HFFLSCSRSRLHLHSFPTRRSSDLANATTFGIDLYDLCRIIQSTQIGPPQLRRSEPGRFPHLEGLSGYSVCAQQCGIAAESFQIDRKSTRLNSSHDQISYAVFCLKK